MTSTHLFGQENKNDEKDEIQKTLNILKKDYYEKDTTKAEEWYTNIFFDNVEVIGTYSIHPNTSEWFKGIEKNQSNQE